MNILNYNGKDMEKYLYAGILFFLFLGSINSQVHNETQGTASGANITTGNYNTMYGDSSGFSLTSGSDNLMIGYRAGLHLKTKSDNVIVGSNAMGGNLFSIEPYDNVIMGARAGFNHYGKDAVIIGTEAGYNNSGNRVVFVGEEAGFSNTSGHDNIFIGSKAGYNNTSASDNVFIGSRAGFNNTSGAGNTFVGGASNIGTIIADDYGYNFSNGFDSPGGQNTTGRGNTALGANAGGDNQTGDGNTFLGYSSGGHSEYADFSTFIGFGAGYDNNRSRELTAANRNTYVGALTGGRNRVGQDNVGMGALADFGSINVNRTVFIGSYSAVDKDDAMVLGYGAFVDGEFGIGIGNLSEVHSTGSIGIGYNVQMLSGSNSIGMGRDANIAQSYAVGLGYGVDIDNTRAIGIGANVMVQGDSSIVIGAGGSITGVKSIGIGSSTSVEGNGSIIIGEGSSSTGVNSIGIGHSISLTASNEVFLGNALTESVGGSVNWTATSDARFKKNVNENIPGLSFINKLRPVSYNFDTRKMSAILQNEDTRNAAKDGQVYTGFIAQEVEQVAAELGFDFSGVKIPENENQSYGLRYAEFVVPLVQAVKELSAKNEAQEKIISAYAVRFQEMESKLDILLAEKSVVEN